MSQRKSRSAASKDKPKPDRKNQSILDNRPKAKLDPSGGLTKHDKLFERGVYTDQGILDHVYRVTLKD